MPRGYFCGWQCLLAAPLPGAKQLIFWSFQGVKCPRAGVPRHDAILPGVAGRFRHFLYALVSDEADCWRWNARCRRAHALVLSTGPGPSLDWHTHFHETDRRRFLGVVEFWAMNAAFYCQGVAAPNDKATDAGPIAMARHWVENAFRCRGRLARISKNIRYNVADNTRREGARRPYFSSNQCDDFP